MNFTVLISAYSINPYKALDDGIAWSIVQALDQKFRLIVVTHPGNRADIEKYLSSSTPEDVEMQAQFEYYDPSFFGDARKSCPPGALLQKYRWHWGVISFIRQRQLVFDLVHHLSFPCGWCPSFLWRLNKPLIWGPAGYPPRIPLSFIQPYGRLALFKDRLCWSSKKGLWLFDPFVRITARKAAHVFIINEEVKQDLMLRKECTTVLSAVATHNYIKEPQPDVAFKVLCVGPFIPISSFDLAIRAFTSFYNQLEAADQDSAELIIIGKGSAKRQLEQIAKEAQLPTGKIQIIESEDHHLINDHLSAAKIYFSPTHDHTDRLLPQALAHGLPVISFDRKNTSQLVSDCCGLMITPGTYSESIEGFAHCLQTLFFDPEMRKKLAYGARQKFERQFTWAARGDAIAEVYWNVYHRNALVQLAE